MLQLRFACLVNRHSPSLPSTLSPTALSGGPPDPAPSKHSSSPCSLPMAGAKVSVACGYAMGRGRINMDLTSFIYKEGELNDKQLEDGMTEKKAIAIINKAKKTGKYDEVKKAGLENFKRDTLWVAVLDTVFPKGFNPDSMRYVPYGNGAQFEMAIRNDTAKSGAPFCLLEVKTPYETYLNGLDKQEIANMKDVQTKLGKYCGLMIGSLETANNNAGNWE